ncbi:pol-like protein [Culex quinquefasciatus]|uniref:Pol-like protein n=1 Tax=Culex quinquefasciatus TaxID=7176 RepID=B0WPL3_CULQU|nr:pol-like protein [Culex quinquefasciatus]|eukprot:XP_001850647.1 pol-like protein [Culex quinquefasciatus]
MFWILRRTGAVNFFNSINNNYAAKGGSSGAGGNAGEFEVFGGEVKLGLFLGVYTSLAWCSRLEGAIDDYSLVNLQMSKANPNRIKHSSWDIRAIVPIGNANIMPTTSVTLASAYPHGPISLSSSTTNERELNFTHSGRTVRVGPAVLHDWEQRPSAVGGRDSRQSKLPHQTLNGLQLAKIESDRFAVFDKFYLFRIKFWTILHLAWCPSGKIGPTGGRGHRSKEQQQQDPLANNRRRCSNYVQGFPPEQRSSGGLIQKQQPWKSLDILQIAGDFEEENCWIG